MLKQAQASKRERAHTNLLRSYYADKDWPFFVKKYVK